MFGRKLSKHAKAIKRQAWKDTLTLATSGFGLVAALAWNELIKEIVDDLIKPVIGGSSGVVSLFIYALCVTILAVVVTYNLTRLTNRS